MKPKGGNFRLIKNFHRKSAVKAGAIFGLLTGSGPTGEVGMLALSFSNYYT